MTIQDKNNVAPDSAQKNGEGQIDPPASQQPDVSPGTGQATTEGIGPPPGEIREDALSAKEKDAAEVETRSQRLASDLVQQKHQLQGAVFSVAMVAICVFYLCFVLIVVSLVCDKDHVLFHKEFPATATVLIAMLGSIPTILMAFLMTGLFRDREHKDKEKDKDEKSPIDAGTLAKIIGEVVKAARH